MVGKQLGIFSWVIGICVLQRHEAQRDEKATGTNQLMVIVQDVHLLTFFIDESYETNG